MKNQHGIGLIEAMIAIIIMGIGLVASMRMYINTNVADQLSRQRTVALQLARSKIEQLRASPTLTATTTDACSSAAPASGSTSTCPALVNTSATFNRSWSVVANADGSLGVNVQVTWKDLRTGVQAAVAGSTDDNAVQLSTSM